MAAGQSRQVKVVIKLKGILNDGSKTTIKK
jgi:hypothetical protein